MCECECVFASLLNSNAQMHTDTQTNTHAHRHTDTHQPWLKVGRGIEVQRLIGAHGCLSFSFPLVPLLLLLEPVRSQLFLCVCVVAHDQRQVSVQIVWCDARLLAAQQQFVVPRAFVLVRAHGLPYVGCLNTSSRESSSQGFVRSNSVCGFA